MGDRQFIGLAESFDTAIDNASVAMLNYIDIASTDFLDDEHADWPPEWNDESLVLAYADLGGTKESQFHWALTLQD